MKILFLLHSYYKYNQGGAELQSKYIAQYLNSKGYDINYLFLYSKESEEVDEGIKIYSIKKKPILERFFGKVIYYKKVYKKIEEINPDIIYHRNISAFGLPALTYSKLGRSKSFLHLAHINDVKKMPLFNKYILKNLIDLYVKKKILLGFDRIIAQAQYQDDLLKKNFQRSVDLIVPNMHPYPKEPDEKNKKDTTVLWIANFKRWKQPEIFVKLAEECQNLDAKFLMIGRSSNDDFSSSLMARIDNIKNISYLGELSISEVNMQLSKSHIFVNTSLSEGFPNTFIQAWMRSVPVVSLNVNPDNVLINHAIGFYSQNFKQLVLDTKTLIKDINLRDEMGKNAKKFSFEHYSLKNIEKIVNLIEKS